VKGSLDICKKERKNSRLQIFEMEVTIKKKKKEGDANIGLARICKKARKLPLML
jgi:hypothetical protein